MVSKLNSEEVSIRSYPIEHKRIISAKGLMSCFAAIPTYIPTTFRDIKAYQLRVATHSITGKQ